MACCAFALFLVAQLLAPFRAALRSLGIRTRWSPDPAVEWRPGAIVLPARPRLGVKRALALFVAVDLMLFGAVTLGSSSLAGGPDDVRATYGIEGVIHASVCGTRRG